MIVVIAGIAMIFVGTLAVLSERVADGLGLIVSKMIDTRPANWVAKRPILALITLSLLVLAFAGLEQYVKLQ
ncbi:hypothetical protein HN358_00225 [Candidatus Uhrbacteria bacterium]|nr:hypothetical protein [Candidatus Uhrbacteria bacterium]MBT7717275.1 hypothetical protein [Candidatus Uhrbacteria bacterium]